MAIPTMKATKEQANLIKKNKLQPSCWIVIDDQPTHLTVRHLITRTVKVLSK